MSEMRETRRRGPWREQVRGLNLLKVEGDDYEMGFQHGQMLAAEIPEGPLPYYASYTRKILGDTLGPLTPALAPLLKAAIGGQVERKLPASVRHTLEGLAAGAGIPLRSVLDGATLPDALLWLASRLMQVKNEGPAMHHRLALGLGCTSALAWGGATKDGMLLHGRNLDYHGVESWPRHPAVIFHAPKGALRYVSVASAGVPLGGITSMNEAGLTLTVHQHMFTDRARLGGVPIGAAGELVMRHARDLGDAERILGEHTPIGCWTYVIADGNKREVLIWEESPDRKVARRVQSAEELCNYANIYLDAELGATENNLYGAYWRHNRARFERARALLEEGRGGHDAKSIAGILGDEGDSSCRLSRSIAMLMTVASVVFRPEDGVLWVATGTAPTSQNAFVPFSLRDERHAPELGEVPAQDDSRPQALAFRAYRDAYVANMDEDDLPKARRLMAEATRLAPEQPLYHFLAGHLALAESDLRFAADCFERALKLGHDDEERLASFHLWRGRALDQLGERQRARHHYLHALGHRADPPVVRAARRNLRRPYAPRRGRAKKVEFSFAEVMAP
ncbi:MAG: hypothetical protein GXP55_24035 [Deltaproteobacteria bacterium]|nr:hypothetical protein [Deltaproteobacteria bacterium]